MTPTRQLLFLSVGIIAILVFVPAGEVMAIFWGGGGAVPSPGIAEPARECSITVHRGSVDVTAGPDGGGGLAEDFPRLIDVGDLDAGDCPGGAPCLEWKYLWKINSLTGFKFKDADVSADSDITVLGCDPDCNVQPFFPIGGKAERLLDFDPPKVREFTGTYYTPVGVGPGTMTATFNAQKGRSWWKKRFGSCAIAGANEVGEEPLLPTTVSIFENVVFNDAGDTCQIERNIDLLSCTVGDIIPSGECPDNNDLTTESLTIVPFGGGTADTTLAISCKLIVVDDPGSFRYCYPNGFGSMTCITFPG